MIAEKLPASLDAERFVLGSLLVRADRFDEVAGVISPDDFSINAHRLIFQAMRGIRDLGQVVDVPNIANRLKHEGNIEAAGGISAMLDLETGIPDVPNIDAYVGSLRDLSVLRRICYAAHALMGQAMADGADPVQILESAKERFLTLAETVRNSTLEAPSAIIEAGGGINAYVDRRNHTAGLKTGFSAFDTMTGGLRSGSLYVIGARPRMGKTAFCLNLAERIAVDREFVALVFSLEMSKESLVDRLICARARVDSKRFEGGWMSEDERRRVGRAAGEIAAADRILIDDKSVTSTQEIHSKVRRQMSRGVVSLVIVDYLQLLIGGESRHRVAEASRVSRDLKLIAKDCKTPLLALSQLSRECDTRDDHRPTLTDLRETGAIEQDADLVGFLYRGEVYHPDRAELHREAELIIAKQRSGPEGVIPLVWLGEFTRFEERTSVSGDSLYD